MPYIQNPYEVIKTQQQDIQDLKAENERLLAQSMKITQREDAITNRIIIALDYAMFAEFTTDEIIKYAIKMLIEGMQKEDTANDRV